MSSFCQFENRKSQFGNRFVLSTGIEPVSQASEACVLSVERRERYRKSDI